MKLLTQLTCSLLVLAGTAAAQMAITNVVNAGSRIPRTSPSGGIAQGALFVVVGRGLGPADLQQASFPLPSTAGLAGITIQAAVGGATVDAIMVYVSATELAAILPSQTPIGTGTVTVNNNGATATSPILVVTAAFGIFRTSLTNGLNQAVAFNVAPDESTAPNGPIQSVQPGQDLLLNGTGLGAIPSDETQPGVIDVPNTTAQVWVGVKPATVVSAGRGSCCDGLDPNFRIPPGIAAWDVIRFTVPDGVTGCFVPVVVVTGNVVSNSATLAIDPSGALCTPPAPTLPPELLQSFTTKPGVTIVSLSLSRGTGIGLTGAGSLNVNKRDTGGATFVKYTNLSASQVAAGYVSQTPNTCGVGVTNPSVPFIPMAVSLDAGASLTITGPNGTRSILRRSAGMLVDYGQAILGNSTPGNYLDPGHYTITGPGGKDIGVFTASIDVPPTPFVWTNVPNATPLAVDRTKGLTIAWTGGVPGTLVTVTGASLTRTETGNVQAAFQCFAPVGAGQITIPSYLLMTLPAGSSPGSIGSLAVEDYFPSPFSASGMDIATINYGVGYSVSLTYR